MSILIRGMKMPKNCDECFFVGYGYPDWCGLPFIQNGDDEISDVSVRPDWCPLVELPEKHGRLVDADSITKDSKRRTGKRLLAVDTAPTVLEAEGEE